MSTPLSLAPKLLRLAVRQPVYARALLRRKIRLARRYRWIRTHPHRDGAVPPPLVYKLVLTYACNLRCQGCFQWGAAGWCRHEPREAMARELDWTLVERLLAAAGPGRPDVILTGGEPLLYSRFEELAALLQHHRCQTTVCTNGTLLDRHGALARTNPYLAFLVSLDGPEERNDALRGPGGYRAVVEHIRQLKRRRRPAWIGIQCTLRPENVGSLHVFCRDMVALGVDWILLNPFWYFTAEEARAYERLLKERFGVTPRTHRGFVQPYALDATAFRAELQRIRAERWPIQISGYFRHAEDLIAYQSDPASLVRERRCFKQWIRIDITPEGEVAPCIQFPDLVAGSLHEQPALTIWNGSVYEALRRTLRTENLPVCARCNNLYLYDAGRRYL
ncbi:MAG: radical SAM protein [Planctomycetes bacterium]|nr:radical SAM protein [Planctomycetota bacterium]